MAVEEAAVNSGAAGDAADADLVAVVEGLVERLDEALAVIAAAGAFMSVVMRSAAEAGPAGAGGCGPRRACRCGDGVRRRRHARPRLWTALSTTPDSFTGNLGRDRWAGWRLEWTPTRGCGAGLDELGDGPESGEDRQEPFGPGPVGG